MLASGQLLADRYRLDKRLAVGGMGEVWQSVDVRLDRTVAVKVLKPELCGDAEFLHRFRTEARMTASLNHPGIAAVHDYGETAATADGPQDTAYLVMELVEGEPLASTLAREGRISAERTLDVLEQTGNALQAAHERGLVHRDVKPGNILVTGTGVVKITDFGIAKAADAAPVTRSGMVMGTAHYIAPEQALGAEASPSSDVYSLAVVGYECLMGHRPFLSDNAVTVAMMHIREVPPPLPPDVPPGARALIEAALVKDPRFRYAAGGEFAHAVAAVRAGHPLPAPAGVPIPAQQQRQPQAQPPSHPRQATSTVYQARPQQPNVNGHATGVHQVPAGPGMTRSGMTMPGMTPSGMPQSGMTQSGMTQSGINQSGINQSSINQSSINQSSINQSGINQSSINQSGITQSGMPQARPVPNGPHARVSPNGVMPGTPSGFGTSPGMRQPSATYPPGALAPPAPSPATLPRNRAWLWIVLAALLLVLVAAGAFTAVAGWPSAQGDGAHWSGVRPGGLDSAADFRQTARRPVASASNDDVGETVPYTPRIGTTLR